MADDILSQVPGDDATLLFSQRQRLVDLFEKWVADEGIDICPFNMVVFLLESDLLNVPAIKRFINRGSNNG